MHFWVKTLSFVLGENIVVWLSILDAKTVTRHGSMLLCLLLHTLFFATASSNKLFSPPLQPACLLFMSIQ
jgi:hypothetical protein